MGKHRVTDEDNNETDKQTKISASNSKLNNQFSLCFDRRSSAHVEPDNWTTHRFFFARYYEYWSIIMNARIETVGQTADFTEIMYARARAICRLQYKCVCYILMLSGWGWGVDLDLPAYLPTTARCGLHNTVQTL